MFIIFLHIVNNNENVFLWTPELFKTKAHCFILDYLKKLALRCHVFTIFSFSTLKIQYDPCATGVFYKLGNLFAANLIFFSDNIP